MEKKGMVAVMDAPYLITDNPDLNDAYRLAVATLAANISLFRDGLLEKEAPVILAGLGYDTPWTRDAAINTWNAGGLLCPEVAENTLKSVVRKGPKGCCIDGEYWDRIIWTVGAWWQYLYTGEMDFLGLAYEAVTNSLEYFENTEFSRERNLFRGPACYGDGVAAYPDIYARHGRSGILSFQEFQKELCADQGVGIPMFALSTNCLYYYAYILADQMAGELGLEKKYEEKARRMKEAINAAFWDPERRTYRYLCDDFGGCDAIEGLGLSFAVLFDVASQEQKAEIFENTPETPHGVPCLYPSFPRYTTGGMDFGRHSGTVWPHIQGFWADAAALSGNTKLFDYEFLKQTENALRHYQFGEIYHPVTGELYGGLQEDQGNGIRLWKSQPFQTWSATAYLRNVYFDLVGMRFSPKGIVFQPVGSKLVKKTALKALRYRNARLHISITGNGSAMGSFRVNGVEGEPFVPADACGEVFVEMTLV